MAELVADAVSHLEGHGIQPTARQVSKLFGVSDGVTKPLLRVAVERGALTVGVERIEKAKGEFSVYRAHPAVRVPA